MAYGDIWQFWLKKNKANSKPILNGMDIILNTEDCRGPTGLAMTECGSFPAGLLEKTKPIL